MKLTFSFILALLVPFGISAQREAFNLTPELLITPLSDNTYMHTLDNSNGIVFCNQDKAIIVSTPPSDEATAVLIQWVIDSLDKEIVAYIIDRWHPDAMEGLDIVYEYQIPSYAFERTRHIAKEKLLPVPQKGFDPSLEIPVGNAVVICRFFGPAHTDDGIVVYIPSEKILFGGNEVRNFNGWIGNIADAHLSEWAPTIRNVKAAFPEAEIVVPGHGQPGGQELLDYTIGMYAPFSVLDTSEDDFADFLNHFAEGRCLREYCLKDTLIENQRVLIEAMLYIKRDRKGFIIESPFIRNPAPGVYRSDNGSIRILYVNDPNPPAQILADYETLLFDLRDDAVEMTLAIRRLHP